MSTKYKISPKYYSLKKSILDSKKNFQSLGRMIKSGRNELKIVEINGEKFLIKSFQIPTSIKSYTYGNIFSSKAKRSFENANLLLLKGIHSPEPVAYIEYYKGLQFQESYYISKYFPHDYDLSVIFKKYNDVNYSFHDWENLLNSFIRFTVDLHNKKIVHLDYNRRNVLILKQDSEYIFSLVDLNRMRFKTPSLISRMRSLQKITSNPQLIKMIARQYSNSSIYNYDKCLYLLQLFVLEHKKYWDTKIKLRSLFK